jgi:hypothetical protein
MSIEISYIYSYTVDCFQFDFRKLAQCCMGSRAIGTSKGSRRRPSLPHFASRYPPGLPRPLKFPIQSPVMQMQMQPKICCRKLGAPEQDNPLSSNGSLLAERICTSSRLSARFFPHYTNCLSFYLVVKCQKECTACLSFAASAVR